MGKNEQFIYDILEVALDLEEPWKLMNVEFDEDPQAWYPYQLWIGPFLLVIRPLNGIANRIQAFCIWIAIRKLQHRKTIRSHDDCEPINS